MLNAFEASIESAESWTPRRLGKRMAFDGLHPCPVGSVEQVADVFEEWVNEADCDGFNVAYVSNPGSFEDVVELLVPELMGRGMMWEDYDFPGGTFRENLMGLKLLRDDHYGSKFKYENVEKEDLKSTDVQKLVIAEVPESHEKIPTYTSTPIAT